MLSAECGCAPRDFDEPGVRVFTRPADASGLRAARSYPPCVPGFTVVSFGSGAVISAGAGIRDALQGIYEGADRDEAFASERLAAVNRLLAPHAVRALGPFLRLLCGTDTIRRPQLPVGIRVEFELDPGQARLSMLDRARWPHALSQRRGPRRPIRALALAWDADEPVGVASASQDSPDVWQVGIDVAVSHRGRGVAPALVVPLARAAFELGCVPFYGVAPANFPSIRAALAAGFVPSWLEVFSIAQPPA
jgi:hypothetical protein